MFLREIFFSDLQSRRVENGSGKRIGLVKDIIVSFGDGLPRVVGICVDRDGYFPVASVGGLSAEVFRVVETSVREPLHEGEWRVGKLLLDQQVIDRVRKRVCCVNDLIFAVYGRGAFENEAFFVGVDVGIRGFFRRLGAEWSVAFKQNHMLGWRRLAMVKNEAIPSCLALDRLEKISASDVTEICRKLGRYDRRMFLRRLPDMLLPCGKISYGKQQCRDEVVSRDGQLPVFRTTGKGKEADGEGGASCSMQYDEDGG